MTMIDPYRGWLYIVKIPTFDLEEVTLSTDEYIDRSSTRVSQLFNNIYLCIYPCPQKFVFDNGSEFIRDFTFF